MPAGNRLGVGLPWDTISGVLPSLSPVKGASKLRLHGSELAGQNTNKARRFRSTMSNSLRLNAVGGALSPIR